MRRISRFAAVCALGSLIIASAMAFAATEKTAPKAHDMKTDAPNAYSSLSGKVVETMNSGGYSYVCLEKNGKKTWVAVPEMKVIVGREMSFQPGQAMPNFTSKSLNRTFDSVIFSGGPVSPASDAGGVLPPGHAEVKGNSGGSKAAVSSADKNIKVEKAAGPDAYTVGEIFAKRKELDKKTVVVKGKVVKVSEGIMGKNWVHLQDGTGDPKKSTHNLVVTTDEVPSVGDVVTIKGTVSKDKDFGSGYKYNVIIEKAAIAK